MRRVLTAGACAVAIAITFIAGQMTGARPAQASSSVHAFTLRMGDRVTVPSINQTCTVEAEAGLPELFCARARSAHHQVVFFRDSISVWTVGNPDNAAWSGKP